jgi:butyrate kinase
MVGFLGRIFVYPGEDEMIALRDGALAFPGGSTRQRNTS